MTIDLIHTDATGLAELIRTGKASSVEVVQAHLDRIEATNPNINAIVTLADGAAFKLMTPTVPFNLTGLRALAMRFGTSNDGMPIAVQLSANSHAESTILHVASLLESLSPVRDQHPAL